MNSEKFGLLQQSIPKSPEFTTSIESSLDQLCQDMAFFDCLTDLLPLINQEVNTAYTYKQPPYRYEFKKAKVLFREIFGCAIPDLNEVQEVIKPGVKDENSEKTLPYILINGLMSPIFRRRYHYRFGNEEEKEEAKEWYSQSIRDDGSMMPDDLYGWFSSYPGWYSLLYGGTWYGTLNKPQIPISVAISHNATNKITSGFKRYGSDYGINYFNTAVTHHRVSPREFIGIVLQNFNKVYFNKKTGEFVSLDDKKITDNDPEITLLSDEKKHQLLSHEAKKYGDFVARFSKHKKLLPIMDSFGNMLHPLDIDSSEIKSYVESKL